MEPRQFICIDCKSHVFSYNSDPKATLTRCYNCSFIHNAPDLSPEDKAKLRKILDCEVPDGENDSAKLGK